MSSPTPPPTRFLVACLCADWCGTCRGYKDVMQQALSGFDAKRLSVAWVDIEDHDEVLGSIDVQNFPTLLIAQDDKVLFFGTLTPHAQTLTRLVQAAFEGSVDVRPVDAEVQALARRVRVFRAGQPAA
jgi:thioredoxin 1